MSDNWKTDLAKQLASISGLEVHDFSHVDFGREQNPQCISVLVEQSKSGINPFKAVADRVAGVFGNPIARKHADTILRELRGKLPPGYVAFVGTTTWHGKFKPNGVELVVGPGESQMDIVRLAQTDACNYDMDTEALVERLAKYDEQVGIDITHAETDAIDFDLCKLPEDIESFAADLYEFCPDLIDQGFGSIPALISEIKSHKKICLWWD